MGQVGAIDSFDFNPLAPRGARRVWLREERRDQRFQSTRPSRGETRQAGQRDAKSPISIHSPLAGRDLGPHAVLPGGVISIHSPLAGRDATRYATFARSSRFQSTRPSRGETVVYSERGADIDNFNPLAPRGARPSARHWSGSTPANFNPLAPRGARLGGRQRRKQRRQRFQSTRPSRGETADGHQDGDPRGISIHSPLPGRDTKEPTKEQRKVAFQSTRPSRGETTAGMLVSLNLS